MTAVEAPESSYASVAARAPLTTTSPPHRHTARLACTWLTSSVAVISAHGEIDAFSADALTAYVAEPVARGRGLILDLRDLDFFGAEGFSALHRISVCCAQAATDWMFIPGDAVSRLLGICDPGGSLPAAGSVDSALTRFQQRR